MPKKQADQDKKSQKERFIDFAREHGADDPEALDKALGEIAGAKPKPKKKD